MTFSDIMRLNISIYTLIDIIFQEAEIGKPLNAEVTNLYLRNWRHYYGLQIIKRMVIM